MLTHFVLKSLEPPNRAGMASQEETTRSRILSSAAKARYKAMLKIRTPLSNERNAFEPRVLPFRLFDLGLKQTCMSPHPPSQTKNLLPICSVAFAAARKMEFDSPGIQQVHMFNPQKHHPVIPCRIPTSNNPVSPRMDDDHQHADFGTAARPRCQARWSGHPVKDLPYSSLLALGELQQNELA